MITLLAKHIGIQTPDTIKPLQSSSVYYICTLIKVEMLAQSDQEGSYFWCHGPSHSFNLRLPKLDGMALFVFHWLVISLFLLILMLLHT